MKNSGQIPAANGAFGDINSCSGGISIKYSYNQHTNHCEKFVYRGCGGNKNKFSSYTTCLKNCQIDPTKITFTFQEYQENLNYLKMEESKATCFSEPHES